MKCKVIVVLICLCFLLLPSVIMAGGNTFIDFDGDGFDDNIIDTDNNGIPDEFQKNVKAVTSTGTFTFSPDALFGDSKTESSINLTVSQQFSLHRFKARQLAQCRSNFESDFNTGLNVNASSGGGCVGGVCF